MLRLSSPAGELSAKVGTLEIMNSAITAGPRTFRRFAATIALAAMLVTGLGASAQAQDPITFPPGDFVVDASKVLTPTDQSALEERLHALQSTAGKALFVVYVDEFTNPSDPQKWLKAAADRIGLGTTDSMLVIGTKSRKAHLESHSRGSLGRYDEQIFGSYIRPALAKGDWAGAGLAAAEGVEAAATGKLSKSGSTGEGQGEVSTTGILLFMGGFGILWFGPVILGGGIVVFVWYRKSGFRQRRLEFAQIPELRATASSAIIELDSALTAAKQEIEFASAQYGESAVASQIKQLGHLQKALSAIFARQSEANSPSTTDRTKLYALYKDMVAACKESMELIERQKEALALLAERQADLPRVIDVFKKQLADAVNAIETTASDLTPRLGAFEPKATAGILEAISEARSGAHTAAAVMVKIDSAASAQPGLAAGMTPHLEQQIDHAVSSLETAQTRWKSLCDKADKVRAFESQIHELLSAARALGSKPRYRQLLSQAQEAELLLRALPARKLQDPVSRLAELKSATQDLERGYLEAKSTEAAIQQALRDMPEAVRSAQSEIRLADSYITRNRRDVSFSARNQLGSAEGMLEAALAAAVGEDQRQVLIHVQAAGESAKQAYRSAHRDVSREEGRRRRERESQMHSSSSSSFGSSGSGFSSGFGSGGSGGSFGGSSGGSGGSF